MKSISGIIIHKPSGQLAPSILLVLFLVIVSYLQASNNKPSPFSTTEVSVEIGRTFAIGDINDFWTTGLPTSLSIAFPFYYGRVEAGIQILRFQARNDQVPDFQTQYLFIGWGIRKVVVANLSAFGGVRLGNQLMTFAGAHSQALLESELGTEVSLGLAIKRLPRWTLCATIRRQRIYTQVPIIFDFGSVSVSRQLPTPDWLREFLE